MSFAIAVLAEAALSFLGFGTPPPTPSWGRMLQESQELLFSAPRLALFPGLAIALAVLGFNLLGDGLRDRLRPQAGGPPMSAAPLERPTGTGATGAGGDVLTVTDLTVSVRDTTLVDGVDLAIGRGERVGLIGESGSGKSLTALAVMGLLPEDVRMTGSVRLAGSSTTWSGPTSGGCRGCAAATWPWCSRSR